MAGILRLEFRKTRETPSWVELGNLWARAPQEFQTVMRPYIQEILNEWQKRSSQRMPYAGFREPNAQESVKTFGGSGAIGSRGRLEGSVRVEGEEVVSGLPHFKYIAGGRSAGVAPPISVIAESYRVKFGVRPGNPRALAAAIGRKNIPAKDPLGDARKTYDGSVALAKGLAQLRARLKM